MLFPDSPNNHMTRDFIFYYAPSITHAWLIVIYRLLICGGILPAAYHILVIYLLISLLRDLYFHGFVLVFACGE